MSTVATAAVKGLAADWKKCYPSAKVSGIVPDKAHLSRGGYHCSRQDQPSSSNYSVIRPDDKAGPNDAAAAIDMTMSASDMRLCTSRLVVAYGNLSDPRRKYLNAFNGTTNNRTAQRWDVYARKIKSATADHLWHIHLEIRRVYTTSATAMRAILSILKGESLSSYLSSIGGSVKASSAQSASTSHPAFPGQQMKRNDSQKSPLPGVKLLQAKLGLPADGFFGAATEAAVRKFQSSRGMTVDGIVGAKTWAGLFGQ